MGRNVARQQQNNCIEAAPMTIHHEPPTIKAGLVHLVPNVLDQLFAYVSPADNVNCHVVYWFFRSIACTHLHNRLAVPQNGVFLLKWPLCFHHREDAYPRHRQFRYVDLLRHNVSLLKLQPAEIIDQIQTFLAGYGAMLLAEVHAAATHAYFNKLNTFVVDFSLFNDELCTNEQTLPFIEKCKNDDSIQQNVAPRTILFGDWQLWAQTIITVTDSCAASLSHFLFITDTFAQHHYSFSRRRHFHLPDEFYQALDFDQMLREMRNLQTLYMLDDKSYESIAMFPDPKLIISPMEIRTRSNSSSNAPHYQTSFYAGQADDHSPHDLTATQNEKKFIDKIRQFAMHNPCEKRQRLSVWNRKKERKADIVLKIADSYCELYWEPPVYPKVTKTLTVLLHMLRTRKLCPSAVRISLEQCDSSAPNCFHWDCMRQILPFFVAGEAEDIILESFCLRIVVNDTFSTFTDLVKKWLEFADRHLGEQDYELFQQQYKLPRIILRVNKTIEIHANRIAGEEKTAEDWVEVIEHAVMQYIRVFLQDAVDARTRCRGLSFYLYESLKRVDFNFEIALDFNGQDKQWQLRKCIELLWQSRAAKFEQRVACEVFEKDDLLQFGWTIHATIIAKHICQNWICCRSFDFVESSRLDRERERDDRIFVETPDDYGGEFSYLEFEDTYCSSFNDASPGEEQVDYDRKFFEAEFENVNFEVDLYGG